MDEQLPDDGFKWFGEGFAGFPKRLPDDCVEYAIYVLSDTLNTSPLVRSRLNEVLKTAKDLRKQYLKDYIWQRESFDLTIESNAEATTPATSDNTTTRLSGLPHVRGRTNFGECLADEDLVVFLLVELSRRFADVWIRVFDTDGEFLLIEAAKYLPKWLNPEIAENRVWINDGHIKIIKVEDTSSPGRIDLQRAMSYIKQSSNELLNDPAIEKEAFHRIRDHPSAISSSLHHAIVTLPRRLAYILRCNPTYISPAIEAFYLRDSISLKPLDTKDIATLKFPPEDFVSVSVKFSKVGYAQLRSQIFDPPPAWVGIMPRMRDEKVALGMKVTCGFEMMVTDRQNQNKASVREIQLLLDDIEDDKDTLPSDAEIETWHKAQDDEKWLDIDYTEFEKELSGTAAREKGSQVNKDAAGEESAQQTLRDMVSRFKDFIDDDNAGVEGIDDDDDDSDDTTGSEDSDREDAKSHVDDDEDDKEFEKSIQATTGMRSRDIENSGLLAEARRLALDDEGDGSEVDEDEEMRKVMELMEQELKTKGALGVNDQSQGKARAQHANVNGKSKGKAKVRDSKIDANVASDTKPFFGPERPPHLQVAVQTPSEADDDDDVGPGDGELSSEDEEFNDVDLGLVKNLLESFKGQAGMSGPAGNLMQAMGLNMPRDDGEDV